MMDDIDKSNRFAGFTSKNGILGFDCESVVVLLLDILGRPPNSTFKFTPLGEHELPSSFNGEGDVLLATDESLSLPSRLFKVSSIILPSAESSSPNSCDGVEALLWFRSCWSGLSVRGVERALDKS